MDFEDQIVPDNVGSPTTANEGSELPKFPRSKTSPNTRIEVQSELGRPQAETEVRKMARSQTSKDSALDPNMVESVSPEQTARENFYRRFQTFLHPHVSKLATDLERHDARQANQPEQYRFLYFNHQNLALKSSLRPPGKKLSSETCRTLRDMHSDFIRAPWKISELCFKCSDGWLIGRMSHTAKRELYLLVDLHEASSLKEVQM